MPENHVSRTLRTENAKDNNGADFLRLFDQNSTGTVGLMLSTPFARQYASDESLQEIINYGERNCIEKNTKILV